ncbi:MAG: hypothetical protein ABIG44_16305 [Planctomycetota bacterium]
MPRLTALFASWICLACTWLTSQYGTPNSVAQCVDPNWSWQPASYIEWAALVDVAEVPTLLVATASGQLYFITARTGQPLIPTPIAARPGVRLAPSLPGSDPRMVYCYDRFAVYAIELSTQPVLRWQAGTWRRGLGIGSDLPTESAPTFQGDPENLTRIVVAHATPAGVLTIRNDGLGGLLARNNGQLLWSLRLPPLSMVRLHIHDDTAALIWKEGQRVMAALFNLATGQRRSLKLPVDMSWPIWSTLIEPGLVTVHPNRVTLSHPKQPTRIWRVNPPATIMNTAIALHTAPRHQRHTLLVGTSDGGLQALELPACQPRWSLAPARQQTRYWTEINTHGDIVLTRTADSVSLHALATGQSLFSFEVAPATRLLHAELISPQVWILTDSELTGAIITATALPLPDVDDTARVNRQKPQMAPRGVFRTAFFAGDSLLIVTDVGLWSYQLD